MTPPLKFRITMKDPDALHDAIQDAVREQINSMAALSDGEKGLLARSREEAVRNITKQWFSYGEYLTIEIDTQSQTATVCPAS